MEDVEVLRAAVASAAAKVKRLTRERMMAALELANAKDALAEALGPKPTPEARAAERELAKAKAKVDKAVKREGDIAEAAGKDPELAMRMARALLSLGFLQDKRRRFRKGNDAFRQLEEGRWIRKIPDKVDEWLDVAKKMGVVHDLEESLEKVIQEISGKGLKDFA